MIVVCPLSRLEDTVRQHRARHVITLLSDRMPATPAGVERTNHLVVNIHDICEPLEGCTLPDVEHIEQVIAFGTRWDAAAPIVVHCFAGISRSTAAAFAIACARNPDRDEVEIARALRAASPTATPNGRIVALADEILGRRGRMLKAADVIGRGVPANEGVPFTLALG